MVRLGRRAVSGGLTIFSGDFIARLIATIGSIVIARLLTPDEYGVIGIALIFPYMFSALTDLGMSNALIRYSSLENYRKYIASGLLFKLIIATIAGVSIFTLATPLSIVLTRPYIAPMLRVLSLYTFSYIVFSATTQIFTGRGKYWKRSLLVILQNIFRVSISIALILIGLRVYGAIWGFSISYTLTTLIALVFLFKYVKVFSIDFNVLKEMLRYSLPLYIPVILGIPIGQYLNILLAWFSTNEEIGNYRIAQNLLTPLSLVGSSISLALFSSFPLLLNEDYKLREAVRKASIYTTIVITPIALALVVFAEPITWLIYGEAYRLAPTYLAILALQGLLTPLGRYVIGNYFNAIGATTMTMRIRIFSTFIGVPLATVMVMNYGIIGLIISSLISNTTAIIYALYLANRKFSIRLNISDSAKALLAPISATIPTLIIINGLSTNYYTICIAIIAYITLLALTIPLFIHRDYLYDLKELTSELRVIGSILSKILTLELRVAKILGR